MGSFSIFARRRDVVRFLLESGCDPTEYDIVAISERWDALKRGVALGALSLSPFVVASCDKKEEEPKTAVKKVENPYIRGAGSKGKGVASEAEDYDKTVKRLREKPWSDLTPQEMKFLGYSW